MYNKLSMAVCSRFNILKIWIVLKHHILIFKNLTKTNINIIMNTSTATRLNMNANSNNGNCHICMLQNIISNINFQLMFIWSITKYNPQFNIHLGNKTKFKFNAFFKIKDIFFS